MEIFSKEVEIRWSDLDPNFHLRHSVYYDLGAISRISLMNELGITPLFMQEANLGPILFREECHFKAELKFGDKVTINLELTKLSPDHRKWSMQHEIRKNGDILAAIILVDGAWMDTKIRKLTVPPELIKNGFDIIPKSPDFSRD